MFQCEIKVENSSEKQRNNRKPFAHLPITTPWKYKVPLNTMLNKYKLKNDHQRIFTTNEHMRQPISNFVKHNAESNYDKQCNFLRLLHLFPSVHPANIHGILLICNYDIYRAVEKLKRSIRLVRGSCQNPNKFGNLPHLNYYKSSDTFSKLNNKCYYCHNTKLQHYRNYVNLPIHINKPDAIRIVPNCYNGQQTYIQYENISRNIHNHIL